jgi:hypothetical protein
VAQEPAAGYWLPGLPGQRWNPGGIVRRALAVLARVGGSQVTLVTAEEVKAPDRPPNVSVARTSAPAGRSSG